MEGIGNPRSWPRRRFFGGLLIALVLLAIVICAFVPLSSWLGSREVSAAMAAKPAPIDGKRAFAYLERICALGPRVAGSQANTRQREEVAAHWRAMGGSVREQPFTAVHPITSQRVDLVNLIGSWHPERTERVVIGVHYDTRPHPDEETDPARHALPFVGANDGASGVALLMEIAHHLETMNTPWGVDLVIFDGEELVFGRHPDTQGEYFLGSKEFARAYVEDIEAHQRPTHYVAGLVLDMVGGRQLQINQEPNSLNLAPNLVRDVWAVARQIDAKGFHLRVGREVLDDHLALNNAGIPTIDLIDFDYPYWHKADDLPKNCSADSLAEVGRVVTAWLAQPKRRTRW